MQCSTGNALLNCNYYVRLGTMQVNKYRSPKAFKKTVKSFGPGYTQTCWSSLTKRNSIFDPTIACGKAICDDQRNNLMAKMKSLFEITWPVLTGSHTGERNTLCCCFFPHMCFLAYSEQFISAFLFDVHLTDEISLCTFQIPTCKGKYIKQN